MQTTNIIKYFTKVMNQEKEELKIANKYIKMCSPSQTKKCEPYKS